MKTRIGISFFLTAILLVGCSDDAKESDEYSEHVADTSSAMRPLSSNKIRKYEKAASAGDVDAAYALYSHYTYLEFYNKKEASIWKKKSADLGHLGSMQKLILDEVEYGNCEMARRQFSIYREGLRNLNNVSLSELNSAIGDCGQTPRVRTH